jgi:hypothetical protein
VTHCYSTGAVSSTASSSWPAGVGGLVGENYGTVTQCYSTGAVSCTGWPVGGLVGYSSGIVTQCYSTGAVSGGGLVGYNEGGLVTGCFWDTQTSGQTTSDGGTGKTTVEMQDIHTYQDVGWDFAGETKDGLHEIWWMPEGGGYPVLAIFDGYTPPQLLGRGTPEDPYLISNALELGAMYYYSPYAHYRLGDSIDLSGIRWGTAVFPWFAGTFDGNGLTISHLTIKGEDGLGLFGGLASGAEVRDLGVVDVNVVGSASYVGGLVVVNRGNVARCYSTGAVSGTGDVGGLVGYNGGIVTQCYSTGAVSGSGWSVGGLVGYNDHGTVTACFWDTETSRQATSAAGTGKTTAEMQTAKTFLDAGWDFVGETKNGTEDLWWILEGKDYPRLWWEAAKK